MFGGLSITMLLGLGLAALLAIGGMTTFAYKHGHDSGVEDGVHSRDKEVKELTLERDTSEANYQTEKHDRERRDAVIEANNRANQQLADASENARKSAELAVAASAQRVKVDQGKLATLLNTARAGTESAAACPKTTATLGDASDAARAFDAAVGTAPAGPPPPAPVSTPPPAALRPTTAPAVPAKALPPAIRVKP